MNQHLNNFKSRPNRATTPELQFVAPGVWALRNVFVNLFFVRQNPTEGPWVLVDAGLPGAASKIRHAAETLFGADARPEAIIMTHGHFDHAGALETLAEHWDAPVYAHRLELPYLTGQSAYPPPDPTVGGGAMALMSFLYPKQPYHLGSRARQLPADGSVPHLSGWRWLHTPGHTPGHVSFFRESDRVLLVGDAFVTTKQESAIAVWEQRQEVHGPPKYFTCDWVAARQSVQLLAKLRPAIAATGHGIAMRGDTLQRELDRLAQEFEHLAVPAQGRYVPQPAEANETGVTSVPPPVVSPRTQWLIGATAVSLGIAAVAILNRDRLSGGQRGKRRYRNRTNEYGALTGHREDIIDPFTPTGDLEDTYFSPEPRL